MAVKGRAIAVVASLIGLVSAGLVGAQTLETRQRELATAKAQAERSARQASLLEARAEAESGAAEQAQAAAAAMAARIQATEADIIAAEARVRLVEKMRAQLRARLAEKQRPAMRLTAALQTMSSRPPALALVQPGTTSDLGHVRMLLAGLRRSAPQTSRLRERRSERGRRVQPGRRRRRRG